MESVNGVNQPLWSLMFSVIIDKYKEIKNIIKEKHNKLGTLKVLDTASDFWNSIIFF